MKDLASSLKKIVKGLSGNIICFGIELDTVALEISKNTNIKNCDILTNSSKKGFGPAKKTKLVYIKNLRKKYKKNKTDYIICNLDEMYKFKSTFIKDSIYITKNKIYIYLKNEESKNLIKKYSRYKAKIEEIKINDYILYKIDVSKSKTNKLKDLFYKIVDLIQDSLNIIGDILAS